jgi:protein-S-isoprenylcysteine O-methyltransferase Ste14
MWLILAVSFAVIALALFLAAGTIAYWQAWVYLAVGALTQIPLMRRIADDPILRESRMRAGPQAEQRPIQKILVPLLAIATVAVFIVPGLDRRFGWSSMPVWRSIVGNVLIVAAMWIVDRVFKENSFGSATVEISKGQTVISTGPYAIVRHPMYSGAAVYFIGLALALGSYWALIPAALAILILVWRLLDEEKFLRQNLPGYATYCAKLRWRLLPGVF